MGASCFLRCGHVSQAGAGWKGQRLSCLLRGAAAWAYGKIVKTLLSGLTKNPRMRLCGLSQNKRRRLDHFHYEVDFPFRAQRDYVHSASLANYVAEQAPQAERFEIVLKNWMNSRVVLTPVAVVNPGEGSGHVKLRIGGRDRIWQLSEDKAHPVTARVPYDEDALVAGHVAQDHRIACVPGQGGSFFDRLIAANKALINQSLDPGVKLIAAKIVTDGFPPADSRFTLQLASHAGTRIFKSHLLIDGVKTGEVIYYGQ